MKDFITPAVGDYVRATVEGEVTRVNDPYITLRTPDGIVRVLFGPEHAFEIVGRDA